MAPQSFEYIQTENVLQVRGITGYYDIIIPDVTEETLHIRWTSKDGVNFMLVDASVS